MLLAYLVRLVVVVMEQVVSVVRWQVARDVVRQVAQMMQVREAAWGRTSGAKRGHNAGGGRRGRRR